MTVTVYQIILFLILSTIWYKIFILLDKKTRFNGDNRRLSSKYRMIFYIGNIFCFLFLKIIREKRKIDYYNFYINHYNKNKNYFDILSKYPDMKEYDIIDYSKETHNKIIRYLKIKKLNN